MEKSEDSDGKTGWIVVGIIIAALLYFYNNRNEEEDPDVVAVRNIVTASRTQNLNRASVPKSSSVSEEIKGENPRKLSGQSSNNRATMSTSEMEL
uniref:Uncharacterized protein n=1 Tax=Panagrolaimus sp. JU765 TaxID=591449 RepID=A0AC34R0V5_9BILA